MQAQATWFVWVTSYMRNGSQHTTQKQPGRVCISLSVLFHSGFKSALTIILSNHRSLWNLRKYKAVCIVAQLNNRVDTRAPISRGPRVMLGSKWWWDILKEETLIWAHWDAVSGFGKKPLVISQSQRAPWLSSQRVSLAGSYKVKMWRTKCIAYSKSPKNV